jgi:N-acetyl-anhydromuramyl-L-alanine amidase AmpD
MCMTAERKGRELKVKFVESEFGSDDERDVSGVDTVVLHSMYNPNGPTPYDPRACKELLDSYEVSTHYMVDRGGNVQQHVPENRMAWHAGKSKMPDGRTGVNKNSVGVEIIGNETDGFTDSQYESTADLTANIAQRLPIRHVVGHNVISTSEVRDDPKTDPWNFDWKRFRWELKQRMDTKGIKITGKTPKTRTK